MGCNSNNGLSGDSGGGNGSGLSGSVHIICGVCDGVIVLMVGLIVQVLVVIVLV